MIDRDHDLPVKRQAELAGISRGSVYYVPAPVNAADLALMRVIDELHLEHPFAGARMLRDMLKARGFEIGRKHVATLMPAWASRRCTASPTRAGATPSIRSTRTCCAGARSIAPTRSWAMDLTYIPMARKRLPLELQISRRASR